MAIGTSRVTRESSKSQTRNNSKTWGPDPTAQKICRLAADSNFSQWLSTSWLLRFLRLSANGSSSW